MVMAVGPLIYTNLTQAIGKRDWTRPAVKALMLEAHSTFAFFTVYAQVQSL